MSSIDIPTTAAAPAPKKKNSNDFLGTGRRKTSVARVRIRPGKGKFTVNSRPLEEFFHREQDRHQALLPLEVTQQLSSVDVLIKVHGGGIAGQAGAVKLGIARALKLYETALEPALREKSLLTRDGRMKERKKYGLRGARRGTQFSKR